MEIVRMFAICDHPPNRLALATRQRLREIFAGRTCFKCGRPAVRLTADHFYCADHYQPGDVRHPRLPRIRRRAIQVD